MSFVGILGAAVMSAVIGGILRQVSRETAVYVSAASSVLLALYAVQLFRPVLLYLCDIGKSGIAGNYVIIIIKLTAIGTLTTIVADICADMGENSISHKAELVGKGAAAAAVLPVLEELVSLLRDLLM